MKTEESLADVLQSRENTVRQALEVHDSVCLLSASAFLETSLPPDYEESSHYGQLSVLEHLCVLTLKAGNFPQSDEKISPQQLVELAEAVRHQRMISLFLRGEAASTSSGEERRKQMLKDITAFHFATVRSPDYYEHISETLEELFSNPKLAELESLLGFDPKLGLDLFEQLKTGIQMKLAVNSPLPSECYRHLLALLTPARREAETNSRVEDDVNVEKVDRFLNELCPGIYCWSLNEILELTGVPEDILKRFLALFTCRTEDIPPVYRGVGPVTEIQRRPLIVLPDGRLFLGLIEYIPWAIRPRIEEFIKAGAEQDSAKKKFWDRYQSVRGDFIVEKVVSYFRSLAPNCRVFENLEYENPDAPGSDTELDVLIIIDKSAFLVECKGGSFSEPAKRGAEKSLETSIDVTINEGSHQAARALHYIRSSSPPAFHRKGVPIDVDLVDVVEFIPSVILFDSVDAVSTQLKTLKELGWLGVEEDRYPWVMSLLDLRTLLEMTEWPSQLLHYLSRRLPISNDERVSFPEELDLFGLYLHNGLYLPAVLDEGNYNRVQLESFTDAFDAHFIHGAEIPRAKLPDVLRDLLNQLEASNGTGHSAISKLLLDASGEAQETLANAVSSTVEVSRSDGRAHDLTFGIGKLAGISIFVTVDPNSVVLESKRLRNWCILKKYRSESALWCAMCLLALPNGFELASFVCLDIPWEEDEELEAECSRVERELGKSIRTI